MFFPSTEDEGPSCQAFTPRTEVAAESETFLGKGEEESLQILPEIITRDKRALPDSGGAETAPYCPLWRAAFNILSACFGTGILSLPYTVLRGGWVSIAAFIAVPIICSYTATILVDCLYDNDPETGCRVRVRSSYEEVGVVVWPRYGRRIVNGVFRVSMFLVSTAFLVLAGSFLKSTFPNTPINERLWTVIAGAVVVPTLFLTNIPQIAWVSMVGVLANIIPVVVTLWYGFGRSSQWSIYSIQSRDIEGIFIAINIITFSYGFHGIIISIENSVAKKSKIYPLTYACVLFSTSVNIVFALCGFLSFTGKTQDLITNNLPIGLALYLANAALAIKVVFSYALPTFFVVEYIDNSSIKTFCLKKVSQSLWFVLARLLVFSFSPAVAVFLPHFGLVIAFTSSIGGSALIFLFPTIFHLKLKQLDLKNRLCDYFVFILGLFAAVLGVFFSTKEFIDIYKT